MKIDAEARERLEALRDEINEDIRYGERHPDDEKIDAILRETETIESDGLFLREVKAKARELWRFSEGCKPGAVKSAYEDMAVQLCKLIEAYDSSSDASDQQEDSSDEQ